MNDQEAFIEQMRKDEERGLLPEGYTKNVERGL
jgi:hypothetical protein